MKKVIVTGANGFIGTALCRELSNQGISVIAVVRNEEENISNIENLKGLRVVYSDLSEFKKGSSGVPVGKIRGRNAR